MSWGSCGDPEDVPHPWKMHISPGTGWVELKTTLICTFYLWGYAQGCVWWGNRHCSKRNTPHEAFLQCLLSLEYGSPTAALLTFGTGSFFVGHADLCLVECWAVSLASTSLDAIAFPPSCDKQKCLHGISLVVHFLGLHAPNAGGLGSIPS